MSANYTWQAIHPIYNVPFAVVQSSTQPTIHCTIRQYHTPRSEPIKITHWINANYFLWCTCAGLADHSPDAAWTQTFNTDHRATWDEIQARVHEVEGESRFTIPIPEPPVENAVVIHHAETGPVEAFTVCPEARPSGLQDVSRNGIWRLLRFVSERGAGAGRFDVVLHMARG